MTELIRYGLIGKEDIKTEPRNGTYEQTLADGRRVIVSALDVAYLLSDAYATASLPSANIAGRIARVTDGKRGFWWDTGTQWNKIVPAVNVRDFNAKGDGATDDTTAIQAAIDSLDTSGGTVFFPEGTYIVTQLIVASNIILEGIRGASILKRTVGSGSNRTGIVTNADQTNGNTDLLIRNLTFQRTIEVAAFDEHVYLKHCSRVRVEGCRFLGVLTATSHTQKGVHYEGCQYTVTRDNIFDEIADNALAYNALATKDSGYHVCEGNTFLRASSDTGSQIIAAQHNISIVSNLFKGGGGTSGNWVESGVVSGSANVKYLTVVGNTSENFPRSLFHECSFVTIGHNTVKSGSIQVDQVSGTNDHVTIVGNTLESGYISVKFSAHAQIANNVILSLTAVNGIQVQNSSSHIFITGNLVRRAGKSGINTSSITGSLKVDHNVCYDNGQDGGADAWFGIFLDSTIPNDSSMSYNLTYDTQGGSATQRHGLCINTATRMALVGNISHDNLTGAYREIGTITYALRTDNIFSGVLDATQREVNARVTPTYGASVAIDASLGNTFVITATNGTAFTVANLTNGVSGQTIRIRVRNTSGGALGVLTWDTAYKLGAAWTQPANSFSRTIDFDYDGTNWVEANRSSADIAN